MSHLDYCRQGIDSTSLAPAVIPHLLLFLSPYSATVPPMTSLLIYVMNSMTVLAMDCIVYNRLYTTADFDATGRFSVSSPGSKYAYQFVSCFNDNIPVEPMTSRTSASYITAYDKTFFHWSRYGHVPSFIRLRWNIDRPRKVPSGRNESHFSILSNRISSRKSCGAMYSHLEEPLYLYAHHSFLQVPDVLLE